MRRAILTVYSIIWLALLALTHLQFCPDISRSYHPALYDMTGRFTVPSPAKLGVAIIGVNPSLSGGHNGIAHYLIWIVIYASALLPLLLLYRTKDINDAHALWGMAFQGSALLVLVLLVLTAYSLWAPIYLVL